MKHNFTEAYLKKLPFAEKGKRYIVYDEKVPYLVVRVNDKGDKKFYIYKKMGTTPIKSKLGDYEIMSVEEARKLAIEKLSLINLNKNPNEEKKKLRLDMKLVDFWNNQYLPRHVLVMNKDKTQYNTKLMFDRYFVSIYNKKMLNITRDDIEKFHKNIGKLYGIYAANRCLALIRHMYNKAIEWGFPEENGNPASKVKMFKEVSRDRFLNSSEISRLFKVLNSYHNLLIKDFIYVSLLTGQRRNNVLSIKWKDIDLKNRTIYISDTKNNTPLTIPISNQLLDILYRMKEDSKSEWLFPSKTSKSGHLEDPKRAWKEILSLANIQNFRLHDLRRTFGSYQAIAGSSLNIIGKSLGHKSTGATQIYSRLSLGAVEDSVQKATDKMFLLSNGDDNE